MEAKIKVSDGGTVTADGIALGEVSKYESGRWAAYAGGRSVGMAGYGHRTRREAIEALVTERQVKCAKAAFGEFKCYACDAAPVGTTIHNGQRKGACARHAEPSPAPAFKPITIEETPEQVIARLCDYRDRLEAEVTRLRVENEELRAAAAKAAPAPTAAEAAGILAERAEREIRETEERAAQPPQPEPAPQVQTASAQVFEGDFSSCTKWLADQTGFDLRDLEGNDGNVETFKRIVTTTRVILTTLDKGDEFEIVICCTDAIGQLTYLEHANF